MGNDSLSFGVNWTGVLLGGVVAGLILVGFGILDVTVSERDWLPWLENLSRAPLPFTTAFQGAGSRVPLPFLPLTASISAVGVVVEMVIGLWALWLYAAISLRYGQGPKTAVVGGLAAWLMIALVTFSFASMAGTAMGSILFGLGFYLVTILVATTVGSLLYKDAAWVGQPEMAVPAKPAKASKPAIPEPAREPAPAPAPKPAAPARPPAAKPPEPPAPVRAPLSPPPPPAAPTAPTASAEEKTVSSAENIPPVKKQAPPAPPTEPPKEMWRTTFDSATQAPPAGKQAPPAQPAAEQVPSTTLSYAESPAPAEEKAPAATPPAEPTPPSPAGPASTAEIDARHQELHETVVALELNIEVAVREVLRIFGQQPLSLEEIVQHLSAVRWDFGELHPRVATGEALKNLVARGGAKEEDGKYNFSRA